MSSEPQAAPSTVEFGLTAVLLVAAEHGPGEAALAARRAALAGPYGDAWLRVRPLAAVGLIQVELYDAAGRPCIDPAFVSALSGDDKKAVFLHQDLRTGHGVVHAFVGGKEIEGSLGPVADLDEKVRALLGKRVSEIVAADDGTRFRPSVAASGTVALSRGRTLAAATGTPTGLSSFGFHDRRPGAASPSPREAPSGDAGDEKPAPEPEPEGDCVALVAFDAEAVRSSWQTVSGAELSARVSSLPERIIGPLKHARQAVADELAALGEETPEAAGLRSVRALELVTLAESYLFGGGDEVSFVDERLLPMFSLSSGDAQFDDADEAEALEKKRSVLEAMVEVMPFSSPEGSLLEQIADAELRPLSPWAAPGEDYVGSIFVLGGDRLRKLLGATDERDLAARVDRFYRLWWKAQTDDPMGEVFERWRNRMDREGSVDIQRFLLGWAEWRAVLEMAAANNLQTALVFYG